MICLPGETSYKWIGADGGWDHGRLVRAGRQLVTTQGLCHDPMLLPTDLVQIKRACDGGLVFVDWQSLTVMETRGEE